MKSELVKVYEVISEISGKIEVWQDGWERKLIIGGATQSIFRLDGSERGYWLGLAPQERVESALILGLGGGTAARVLRKRWPAVKIVGIELDPAVVRVATSYLGLDPAVEVRIQDFRQALAGSEKFDLIIVDLYQGNRFLEAAAQNKFLRQLPAKLTQRGLVGFNRIPISSNQQELSIFETKLRDIFKEVWIQKADYNLIYWGRR